MDIEIKLFFKSKNTMFFLMNEKLINDLKLNNKKEFFYNVIIDKDYNMHLILSNKHITIKNNIYYFVRSNPMKNSTRSKDYRIYLNQVIISLFNPVNSKAYLKNVIYDNNLCYELVFK